MLPESYLSRVYSRAKETVNKLVKGDDAPAPDGRAQEYSFDPVWQLLLLMMMLVLLLQRRV
jgi:hypothetical protein